MRPILALLFLSLALAARPGEVLVLPFLGLPPGPVEVASDLPLLLTPSPGEGPFLVVVEVPKEAPPGSYRVCLRPRGGTEVCQKVEVEAIRDLEARVPREAQTAGKYLTDPHTFSLLFPVHPRAQNFTENGERDASGVK